MTAYTQQSRPGSRSDAEPTDRLPTLVPGRDRLPTSCSHCGSSWLDNEPPLGPHQRGMLWCQTCSRSLCWLAVPLVSTPVRGGATVAPAAPSTPASAPAPAVVPRRIIAAGFTRRPHCGPSCTDRFGHDPVLHEQYGADAVYAERRARRSGDIVTGPLLVQLGPARAYLDGVELGLWPNDWEVLVYLAERLGELCTLGEIVAGVWGQAYVDSWQSLNFQPVRNNLMRIRRAFGSASALLENERWRGYRLRDEP